MTDILTPPTFAVETDYPAGSNPWNGQPLKVAPVNDYFTPDTKPPAETFNYTLNGICNSLASLTDAATFGIVSNWNPIGNNITVVGGSASSGIIDIAWDAYYQRWISNPTGGSGYTVAVSNDGVNWVSWGSGDTTEGEGAICSDPATGRIISLNTGGGTGTIGYWTAAGVGTFLNVAAFNGAVGQPGQSSVSYFNGVWQAFAYTISGSSFTGNYTYSTNPAPGGSWTNGTLPTTSASGTNHPAFWAHTQSPTELIMGLCGTTASTVSGTDYCTLIISTNGTTFTDFTPSFFSGKILTGLHYSANDGIYGLIVYDGTSSYLYTTATPTTSSSWSLVKTFTNRKCVGLTNVGRVWMTQGKDTSGIYRGLASNNVLSAGSSSLWQAVPYYLTETGSPATPPSTLRTAGGSAVLAWNYQYYRTSATFGTYTNTSAY